MCTTAAFSVIFTLHLMYSLFHYTINIPPPFLLFLLHPTNTIFFMTHWCYHFYYTHNSAYISTPVIQLPSSSLICIYPHDKPDVLLSLYHQWCLICLLPVTITHLCYIHNKYVLLLMPLFLLNYAIITTVPHLQQFYHTASIITLLYLYLWCCFICCGHMNSNISMKIICCQHLHFPISILQH